MVVPLAPVRVGDPIEAGPLSLFPLFHPVIERGVADEPDRAPRYRTAPEMDGSGILRIVEKDGGTVPVLELHNSGESPVLVLAGEIVEGNRQNRSVNVTLLAPPASTIDIPVSCVERGRWGTARSAGRAKAHVPPDVRRSQAASVARSVRSGAEGKRSAQGAVWDAVSSELKRAGARSATQNLTDAFDVGPDLADLTRQLRPLPDQVGVAAVVGERVIAVDVFDSPDTLSRYWSGLVSGYVLGAAGAGHQGQSATDDGRTWRRSSHQGSGAAVAQFLGAVRASAAAPAPGVGLGSELHLNTEDVVGSALLWQDELIHLGVHPAA